LFREGQGVVIDGTYTPNATFSAQTLLARHDERYMPREVERALKARGEWKGGD
jgi:cytochrome c-type biogenesis protein CcmE